MTLRLLLSITIVLSSDWSIRWFPADSDNWTNERALVQCAALLVSALVPQFVVDTLQLQQLLVVTLLRHFSLLDHKDDIHILDGGQSVGYGDGGPTLLGGVKRVLDNFL